MKERALGEVLLREGPTLLLSSHLDGSWRGRGLYTYTLSMSFSLYICNMGGQCPLGKVLEGAQHMAEDENSLFR